MRDLCLWSYHSRVANEPIQDRPAAFAPARNPPSATPELDSTASLDDKVGLMRSLFGARTDVFALRWKSVSKRQGRLVPCLLGGWVNRRARKEYLPFTDSRDSHHPAACL